MFIEVVFKAITTTYFNINMADSLMKCLIEAGYKATRIASTIRKDEKLFDILVQQKSILPNSRVDFKTLADVLIQQVVIHTVDEKVCLVFIDIRLFQVCF